MRVMVMIEGSGADEDKIAPTPGDARADGRLQRGTGQGRHHARRDKMTQSEQHRTPGSSSKGGSTSVVDGPFTESKEIIAG